MEGYLVYCVFVIFCLFVILYGYEFMSGEKASGVNFACMLAYYPYRSSPLLVKIGSWGVTGAAALRRG